MVRQINVLVIGGGITGLAAAYEIQKKSAEAARPVEVFVLERGDAWGGKIRTEATNGFVIEGGPDAYLVTKPWARELCRDLGLEGELQGTDPDHKETFILHGGRLHTIPDGLTMTIPTRFGPILRSGLLSWPAKLRMGMDFIIPRRCTDEDESLGAFVSRRLGRAAYENLVGPLLSGVYAGDGDQLSVQATFPILRELELAHGGLVKGALALRHKRARRHQANGSRRRHNSIFEAPVGGLGKIVTTLVDQLQDLGVTLCLGVEAREIRSDGAGFQILLDNGEVWKADRVVLATPAFAAAEMLAELDPVLAGELQAIPYISTATISLGFRQEDLPGPLNGYGYIIPLHEGRQALACTWTSSKWRHRAPEGLALIRVFAGRVGDRQDLPTEEQALVAIAREEIAATLGIRAEPVLSRTFLWENAMPQYNLGHTARVARIMAAEGRWPGLALAGGGYHGIGIPDCIRSGRLAAERVMSLTTEKNA